jgi:acyl-CoA synthetase (AMP-forming)/AMP-acid ligase II/3-hydroxymyristoyl/3-hydroxydecanoyl-(acyl carrier protein) dehydratase
VVFRLLAPETAARVICNRDALGGEITQAELARDVAHLVRRLELPEGANVVLLCRDRYAMLVGCLSVWAARGVVLLPPSDRPGLLQHVVDQTGVELGLVDGPEPVALARVLALGPLLHTSDGPNSPVLELPPERLLVSLFTSGTTGAQQRVDKVARQLLGEATLLGQRYFAQGNRNVAATVPAHHLYGLLFSLLAPFLSGARFVRETPLQPHEVSDVLARTGASDLVTVPAHLRALCGARLEHAPSRVFSSGAVLDPDVARQFESLTGAVAVDVLGSTESGGIGVREPVRSRAYQPLPGVEVLADDAGALLLRSPFLPDPDVVTELPDRVALVPEGFLYHGRGDGVIKVAGKRVSLQELESRARELSGIDDAAALVVHSESLRDQEAWLVVASAEPGWSAERVRRELSAHFEPTLLPRRIKVVPQLPRNALGKLERSVALALFQPSVAPGTAFSVPVDWVFFEGHFPGEPILPGAAQLSEIVLPEVRRRFGDLGVLRRIVRLKFKRPVSPGEQLSIELSRVEGAEQVSFQLVRSGEVVSSGVLQFSRASEG